MKIKITNGVNLPSHVRDMGVREGDVFDAQEVPNTRLDAVRFMVFLDDELQWCTVMGKNYKPVH